MGSEKPTKKATIEEVARIDRSVLSWLNTCPEIPDGVDAIKNYLPATAPSMAATSIQGADITKPYIYGGHQAEYQFKIIYRIKPGTSIDKRFSADEKLNKIGAWASSATPDLGENIKAVKVEATTMSALFDAYEDGDEDHQILMKLTYEVNT